MKEIAISKFKATCLAVLDQVEKTREPIRVTRRGKPIAEIGPPKERKGKSWLGSMRGSTEILGDIVGPIRAFEDWNDPKLR